jgi:hypothetical protein
VSGAGGVEVITPEMIEAVYGIPVTIGKLCGRHVVVPLSERTDALHEDDSVSRKVTSM